MTTPKPRSFKRPAVVEVEWVDSMAYSGWNGHEDRLRNMEDIREMDHVSTGYVMRRTSKYIAVTQSMGYAGQVGDTIQIPRSAVKRITVLRKATNS